MDEQDKQNYDGDLHIPRYIWFDGRLSPREKYIYAVVKCLGDGNGCNVDYDYLATFCQSGKITVWRAVRKLISFGYIKKVPNKKKREKISAYVLETTEGDE